MTISVFELFKIGIGPSSSHTVGPMRAAGLFIAALQQQSLLDQVTAIKAEMYGSLGATGRGHGTPKAVLMGLEGHSPESIDVGAIAPRVEAIKSQKRLLLAGAREIDFVYESDLILHKRKSLPLHPNGMKFSAFSATSATLLQKIYYSVGGGFVHAEQGMAVGGAGDQAGGSAPEFPFPFDSGNQLLQLCAQQGFRVSDLMLANERVLAEENDIRERLMAIWQVMRESVENGCAASGVLPGGLNVPRRAPALRARMNRHAERALSDPLSVMDWVTLYALAVNEENAGGGRIVTAPTNGAAGIIPAVMHYYWNFTHGASEDGIVRFLLTAAAIGALYKKNASISGAEVGCQGEVGSACSMAAGALTEVLGGTPEQVENAAEIAMEHNLGLTCDPIGGLVQVPCIERNAMAAIKAISASRMALQGDGTHFVSLDKVIKTMRKTGEDMRQKYKETARGGLAVHVLEVPVNIVDC